MQHSLKVPVSGAVIGNEEAEAIRGVADKLWLTAGTQAHKFEAEFAETVGTKFALMTNSGSSANLIAVASLMQPEAPGRLQPGDKVVTLAAGFPTTVNPIVQLGLKPVFVDIELDTLNVDLGSLRKVMDDKVKAVMLPHMLGNPFDPDEVLDILSDYGVPLVMDCCDALGAKWNGWPVGSYGDIATYSFFPAHQITTGEGGCVTTWNHVLSSVAASLRDWGRDCSCDPGQNGTCGRRFEGKYGELPEGYDHKYVYTHIGYNLRNTEVGAAVGLEQLKKLNGFVAKRRRNWDRLREGLEGMKNEFRYVTFHEGAEPSWFGFSMLCLKHSRRMITAYLNHHGIDTRYLFAGNITKQPAYAEVQYQVSPGGLPNTDTVMNNMFWVGVWSGLTDEHIDYVIDIIHKGEQKGWRI